MPWLLFTDMANAEWVGLHNVDVDDMTTNIPFLENKIFSLLENDISLSKLDKRSNAVLCIVRKSLSKMNEMFCWCSC